MAPSIDRDTLPRAANFDEKETAAAPATKPSNDQQPRFMTSTWYKDATMFSLLTSNPLKALLYNLMYMGPVPKLEGKLGVVSSFEQR